MKIYPIPVHIECKSTRGKLRPTQKLQRARIKKSGSIFLVISRPSEFYDFLLNFGFKNIQASFSFADRNFENYLERDVVNFVRGMLKLIEATHGVYWERNQQNIGSNKGRPDFYVELPGKLETESVNERT
jgi:hypothetical protein